jgi:hypothetical protein
MSTKLFTLAISINLLWAAVYVVLKLSDIIYIAVGVPLGFLTIVLLVLLTE